MDKPTIITRLRDHEAELKSAPEDSRWSGEPTWKTGWQISSTSRRTWRTGRCSVPRCWKKHAGSQCLSFRTSPQTLVWRQIGRDRYDRRVHIWHGLPGVPLRSHVRHSVYRGLDQIVIGPIPRTLAGKADAQLRLVFDALPANLVTVSFR
jgi:hypothetical protein